MSVAASRPPAPLGLPSPLPVPTQTDREPASHPFADLLRQNRGVEPPSAEAPKATTADFGTTRVEPGPEPTAASDDGVPSNDSAPRSDAGWARVRAGATHSRSTTRAADATERPDRSPEPVAERSTQDDARSPADASTATASPALAMRPDASRPADPELRFDAASHFSPPAASDGRDADSSAAGASTPAIESSADGASTAHGTLNAEVRGRTGTDAIARVDTGRSAAPALDSDAAAPAASFAQILAEAQATDRPAPPVAAAELPQPPAAAIAAHQPRAPATLDNALPPQTATLPVPADSPEFAAAFGVQVSVFVREGVQHAELHLNPVETGPVSIAITVEGSQARVEFGADLAATRQAIESGLPALASALRDAGFTLAGGGVAQHSRSGSGQGREDPTGRGRSDRRAVRGGEAIAAPAVQRASHRVTAGGIDLYA